MTYVQFYSMSTGYVPGSIPPQFGAPYPIEATGDRGIIRVDGRLSADNIDAIARQTARERGYIGYKILRGASLLRAQPTTDFQPC